MEQEKVGLLLEVVSRPESPLFKEAIALLREWWGKTPRHISMDLLNRTEQFLIRVTKENPHVAH